MWDGRKVSLEDPALGPMSTSAEMNPGSQPPRREARSYRRLSDGVHHGLSGRGISVKNVARAIATFERTVISSTAQSHRRRTPLPPLRQSESRCQALWVSFRCRSRSGHSLRSIAMPAHAPRLTSDGLRCISRESGDVTRRTPVELVPGGKGRYNPRASAPGS